MRTASRHITLNELAGITGGTVIGDGNITLAGVCSLDNPIATHIAFAVDVSKIKLSKFGPMPAALIVSSKEEKYALPQLIHNNPREVFAVALQEFYPDDPVKCGIDKNAFVAEGALVNPTACVGPFAVIEPGANIGAGVKIGAGCYIGHRTVIGTDTVIHPNATIMHDVKIGQRCNIHPGVVIGADGFGFTQTSDKNLKVPQIGSVEIGNDVEIGANSTIDRATIDVTRIADDVKIDNLVQIAHNVQIGPHTRIAAQVGISGRAVIEQNVIIAGQAGFQNGIRVGEGSVIGGRAGVTRNVPSGSTVSGYPARDHRQALQILAAQNRLPEILERLEKIEKRLQKED